MTLSLFSDEPLCRPLVRWSQGAFTLPGCADVHVARVPERALRPMLDAAPQWAQRMLATLSYAKVTIIARWLAIHRAQWPNCGIEIIADPHSPAIIYLRAHRVEDRTPVGTALCLTRDDIHRGEEEEEEDEDHDHNA